MVLDLYQLGKVEDQDDFAVSSKLAEALKAHRKFVAYSLTEIACLEVVNGPATAAVEEGEKMSRFVF